VTPCAAARRPGARAAAILALAAILYLPSVWNRDLWAPDEPKYAEAAREMTTTGDFILPHLNGDVYPEKPPLFFWLSIAASRVPGVPPGAGGRLVSVIASTATLLLTWRIGAIVMGEATGALAAFLLATSVLFWQLGQSGVIDPLLTALCTTAAYGFVSHRCGARTGMPIFYASCSLGVLAKGPVGFIVPALTALAYTSLRDGWRSLRASHPLWGIPLVIAPVALWLQAAASRGGSAYLETMLIKQNVGRAYDAFIHKEPLYYFLLILPVAFLPWTVFLPQALAASVRERVGQVRPMLFPLAWFASTFILFSAISGKKTRYMLPLFPAAALLVAGWMMRRFFEPDGRIRHGRGAVIAAALLGVGFAGVLAAPAVAGSGLLPRSTAATLSEPGSEAARAAVEAAFAWPGNLRLIVPAVLLGGCCAWAVSLAFSRRGESFAALFAGWALLLATGGPLWAPVINRVKSAAYLASEITQVAGEGPLYYVGSKHSGALNFYLKRDRIPLLRTPGDVLEAARDPSARFIGSREEFLRVQERAASAFSLGPCRRIGEDVLCLAKPSSSPS